MRRGGGNDAAPPECDGKRKFRTRDRDRQLAPDTNIRLARLRAARLETDARLTAWAAKLDDAWLAQDQVWYSGAAKRDMAASDIAVNEQRFARNITNVVSADEFGTIADGSVGEFMKFLPGISIDYVGGTANTISMDGVPANYVPVTVAGFDPMLVGRKATEMVHVRPTARPPAARA